jgi:hypothetical protein
VVWVALALLGLVVAAGVSLAASRLSSQHIGLSSEPLTAGEQLAPAIDRPQRYVPRAPRRHHHHKGVARPAQPGTQIQPQTPIAPPPTTQITPAPLPSAPTTPRSGGRDDSSSRDDSGGSTAGRGVDD